MNFLNVKQLPCYLFCLILTLSACQKDNPGRDTFTAQDKIQNVKVENGYLVFKDKKAFDEHLEKSLESDTYSKIWNQGMNFTSASDLFEQASLELESVTTMGDANAILNKYNGFISFNTKDSTIELTNIPKILSRIVNKEGIVKIGKDLYKFTTKKQYILMESDDPTPLLTKNLQNSLGYQDNLLSINYKKDLSNARIPSNYGTIASTGTTNGDGDRQAKFRIDYLSIMTPVRDPTTYLVLYWEVGSTAYLNAWGLKKGLFGWSFYKTKFTFNQLSYSAYSYPGGISNIQNYSPFTTGDTKDYYHYILRTTTQVSVIDFNTNNYVHPQINLDFDMNAHSQGVPNPKAILSYH